MSLADEVASHRSYVLSVARRIVPVCDAEDAAHDAIVLALSKLHQFEGRSSLRTWLHCITVRSCLTFRKRQARIAAKQAALLAHPVCYLDETFCVMAAVDALSAQQRDVIAAFASGEGPQEYAARTGAGELAVKSRLHRARKHLKEALCLC